MAKVKTWREIATPIIHQVLTETKGKPEAEIKKALFEAYPFGPRKKCTRTKSGWMKSSGRGERKRRAGAS